MSWTMDFIAVLGEFTAYVGIDSGTCRGVIGRNDLSDQNLNGV